jgi:hypothetical protein
VLAQVPGLASPWVRLRQANRHWLMPRVPCPLPSRPADVPAPRACGASAARRHLAATAPAWRDFAQRNAEPAAPLAESR